MLVFNENDEDKLLNLSKGDRIMEEYIKDAIDASSEDEVIGLYDKELHEEKLRLSEIAEAKQAGIKDGIKVGIKETAKNMLKDNISIDNISKYTGLTKEEIENLK